MKYIYMNASQTAAPRVPTEVASKIVEFHLISWQKTIIKSTSYHVIALALPIRPLYRIEWPGHINYALPVKKEDQVYGFSVV